MIPTRLIPLGGVQEIGKSTLLVEHNNHIFILDAGIKFADTYTTGIKGIIPDYSYLNQPGKIVEGLFITHGHEDHIGGVVHLVKQVNVKKIFAPRIAIQYLQLKFDEHGINQKDIKFIEIEKSAVYKFPEGCVVDFWTAQHSIPDAFGIRLTTPNGSLMCTGDFRFDYTPIGNYTDFSRLDQIGKEGLTVLLSDSTNAMRPFHSPSEKDILTDIEKHFLEAKGKIIVTAFASNLTRVKVIIDLAARLNKKVITFGRSMIQGVKIGRKLGYIDVPSTVFVDKKHLSSIKDNELVILTTGSQGEQLAALSRMSYGKHASVKIVKGDTIIFSSSPIPGNRMVIELLINRLYKLGAIIKENGPDGYLHTSGHAYKHEHAKIFQLTKPKFFLPYHGEYRMCIVHGQSAVENGVDPKNIIIPQAGVVYNMLNKEVSETTERINYGPIYIDGNNALNLNANIIKERSNLSQSGFVSVVLVINKKTNTIIGKPHLISRGCFFVKTAQSLVEETKRISHGTTLHYIKNTKDWNVVDLKQLLTERLKNLFYKEKRRDPVIVPVILFSDEETDKNLSGLKINFGQIKSTPEVDRTSTTLKKQLKEIKSKLVEVDKDDLYDDLDEEDEK
ncbi:ribonuclease J [Mycoplasmopsis alligatoris]|uniref:Metallo-beta-lactamase domain-containing protein n=1 Tax=Mycoplasmopsis alligatoris A21JP2 TaxID=747682 RepID=D4XVV2_9BACT|nr:ribonuclease J [Mycoplasmopsis alligatoris]EFF41530.1 conserved hypothetical protein [Mycoplasmopsis alligatoris A21JP2]